MLLYDKETGRKESIKMEDYDSDSKPKDKKRLTRANTLDLSSPTKSQNQSASLKLDPFTSLPRTNTTKAKNPERDQHSLLLYE